MQYKNSEFDPEKHDRFPALTVKQPYASMLIKYKEGATIDNKVYPMAEKSIEVRSKNTKYRGDILITSSSTPVFPGMESGVTLGLVELYGVKPIKEFTQQDWENTGIPKVERHKYNKGYGWLMRNPRRVIEYPVKGQVGIWNLVYTKGDVMEYPTKVRVDKKSYKILTSKKK